MHWKVQQVNVNKSFIESKRSEQFYCLIYLNIIGRKTVLLIIDVCHAAAIKISTVVFCRVN